MSDIVCDHQVFYLEGGKTYYISQNIEMGKGFTLETLPEDVVAGKRATVYMVNPESAVSPNFVLGMSTNSGYVSYVSYVSNVIMMSPITFRNIDFECPLANNYGNMIAGDGDATGNYFINSYYTASATLRLEALNIENCSFQGFKRGFLRMQGASEKIIRSLNCDGNLFYNCGYFDNNGRGYGWFAGTGNLFQNMYVDFKFVNNTIYDCPFVSLIQDLNKNLAWPEDFKWNITIENNTIINFSTRSSNYLINMRYVPDGSHFSVQRNLFSLAKNDEDGRSLNFCGAYISQGRFHI